ncbi:MAG: hypothetical protein ACE5Z5_15085, partial [Candidatus Bathyarchaeia archaeon]
PVGYHQTVTKNVYSVLSIVGENVYVGRLVQLLEDLKAYRGGNLIIHDSRFVSGFRHRFSLSNKDIVIPSALYRLDSAEEEIVVKAEGADVYVLRSMTPQEVQEWIWRLKNSSSAS